jgi:hypothetical protein
VRVSVDYLDLAEVKALSICASWARVARENRGEGSDSGRAAPELFEKNLAKRKYCGLVRIT